MRTEAEKAGYTTKGVAGLMGLGLAALGVLLWKSSSSNTPHIANGNRTDPSTLTFENELSTTFHSYQNNDVRGGGGQELTQKSFAARGIVPASILNSFDSLTALQSIKAAAIAAALVITIVLIPKLPEINICSTEIDWDSILMGLQDGYFQTSVISLISIHNPSLYAVRVDILEATFSHSGTEFGTFSMEPVTIESQSITDDMTMFTFAPKNMQVVYDMISAYTSGSLNITVDAKIGATFPSISNASFSRDIDGIFVDLSDDGENEKTKKSDAHLEDKHLCACS